MKKYLILIAVLFLTGCNQKSAEQTFNDNIENVCIDGVTYIKAHLFRQGSLSVKFDTSGSIILCGGDVDLKNRISELESQLK